MTNKTTTDQISYLQLYMFYFYAPTQSRVSVEGSKGAQTLSFQLIWSSLLNRLQWICPHEGSDVQLLLIHLSDDVVLLLNCTVLMLPVFVIQPAVIERNEVDKITEAPVGWCHTLQQQQAVLVAAS